MELEIKTTSLYEIVKKCQSMNLDIKNVKIITKLCEDIRRPDEYEVKLYLKYKKI